MANAGLLTYASAPKPMTSPAPEPARTPFHRVVACEIALREICHAAARSPALTDLEFLPQGLHDTPAAGLAELQRRIDAVPPGRYDAVLIGYGLCGNLIRGLVARHTPLVIPRAHDCLTLFLGSKERYQDRVRDHVGTYYYTSGWLECARRRDPAGSTGAASAQFLPTRAGSGTTNTAVYDAWVAKYGEEEARYLRATMDDWTRHYSHGALIDFDFTRPLGLDREVRRICSSNGWKFEPLEGDLGLLQRWIDGLWSESEFLVLRPGERVAPSYRDSVIIAEPPSPAGEPHP